MQKKKSTEKQRPSNGFESLIGAHTEALKSNSESILEMLEMLKGKKLSNSNKKDLKFIKNELKRLDKGLDDLGKEY